MSYLQAILLNTWFLFIFFLVVLTITRNIMVNSFISREILLEQQYKKSLKRMKFLGFRFDLKITSIFLLPFLLLGTILSLINTDNIYLLIIPVLYIAILSFFYFSIIFGNYFYFKTYNNYYDIFMFGLIEDDTRSILKNIWDDYPVLKVLLYVLSLSIFGSYFTYFLLDIASSTAVNTSIEYVILVLNFILLFVFSRGALRSMPLGKSHAQVSSLNIINKMVPNGVIALEWAIKDRKRAISFTPVSKKSGEEMIHSLFEKNDLLCKTDSNTYLEKNPPNVVFALMESFGGNCLSLDNQIKNDLLGALRERLESAFYFKRFVSYCDGTAPSLAHLYFYSPIQNISQSIAQNKSLEYTPFWTYKKKGYKTIFITSGNIMWRNLGNYLPLQGVDEVYDQNSIIDIFPEAKKTISYWGIADEFAFSLAEKLLNETNVPLFINILTITNHPPYEVPAFYQPNIVNESLLVNRFTTLDESKRALTTFQYSANVLGEFINNIELSNVGCNTIVAASGDHHLRGMRPNLPSEIFLHKSVPFIIHVPKELQTELNIYFDPDRVGSHKDIMPTLYSLSLSDTEYWNLGGRNILAIKDDKKYAFAYNTGIWATKEGVIDLSVDGFCKYGWISDSLSIGNEILLNDEERDSIITYQKLLFWQINYLVKGYC